MLLEREEWALLHPGGSAPAGEMRQILLDYLEAIGPAWGRTPRPARDGDSPVTAAERRRATRKQLQ